MSWMGSTTVAPEGRIARAVSSRSHAPAVLERIRTDGKFFRAGSDKWFVKGVTYGPFAPDRSGVFFPDPPDVRRDLNQIRDLGANAIRVYHTPPRWLLDEAGEAGVRVFIDVPWEKHRCFLEDHAAQQDAIRRVRDAAGLGDHHALFAISVANEIPKDIVRFYGERRVERFLHRLLDAARQRAPECLLTFTNYPSTEFLLPGPLDFCCFNVYLEDPQRLGAYLDRLHHLAGTAPLVLGEHGIDSIRHGADTQARSVGAQLRRVFDHGLAGSFVFSFTDDWFAGGVSVRDWAFGLTDRRRGEKPAARAARAAWASVPHETPVAPPSVSVVVCSYNGAATLEECLASLRRLDYPNFEVILVDDGSTDDTQEIVARFPEVRYIHQTNHGLSAARNVGARRATGEIVAYTDSDCVADEHWLSYLVSEMRRQNVDVIGGPNIPPPNDCWVARCVAASPGGPSHVMLDDRLAEHVPGCNMAFRREALLALGGFDEQFRQAGDDVDICWRFLNAGSDIGYAPAAMVWHHRRSTVRAYLRQQIGYGYAEAMLYFKHPDRFNAFGNSQWAGVIYGEGAHGLAWHPPVIYHGRFGDELFPAIYRQTRVGVCTYVTLLEWHLLAVFTLLLSVIYLPLAWVTAAMWLMTLGAVAQAAVRAPLPKSAPWWCRGLVGILHGLQPAVRAWHRARYRVLRRMRMPRIDDSSRDETDAFPIHFKRLDNFTFDFYWHSLRGTGREALLDRIVQTAQQSGWAGDFRCHWEPWDVLLLGDNWHNLEIRTATEELGSGKRFTRARVRLRATGFSIVAVAATTAWSGVAIATRVGWAQWLAIVGCGLLAARLLRSRSTSRRAAAELLARAGYRAGLEPVVVAPTSSDAVGAGAACADQIELEAQELDPAAPST
jgi:GT2 family glycosyltransferase